MIGNLFLGDVGVIGCTSKVIVPIKWLWLWCEYLWFSHKNFEHTLHAIIFYSCYIVHDLCDLAITSDESVSKSLLNYLDLILELKLDRLFSALWLRVQCLFKSDVWNFSLVLIA